MVGHKKISYFHRRNERSISSVAMAEKRSRHSKNVIRLSYPLSSCHIIMPSRPDIEGFTVEIKGKAYDREV